MSNQTTQPSMVGGHAQYAKGYVESTIGNVTGNEQWKESGEKDMGEGIGAMKVCSLIHPQNTKHSQQEKGTILTTLQEARAQQQGEPAASGIGGKVEEVAGKVAGCEGMEKEGITRQEKAQ